MNITQLPEKYIDGSPPPEYLIKSIAEQGYTLESSLADLIDNSISANASEIEILIRSEEEPFIVYLADNGNGMTGEELSASMQFPSDSPDSLRNPEDLGRFGLGLKTASFSQTRKFTVLSRKKGTHKFSGRTWDVNYLKGKRDWIILINSDAEIEQLVSNYQALSISYQNSFAGYTPNTIIIWHGLYKFEYLLDAENRRNYLNTELTKVTKEHLSLVFHRYLERKTDGIKIRINNALVQPFNPFPTDQEDLRVLENKQKYLDEEVIKIEGFILPVRSIEESRNGSSIWTTPTKGLMELEGVYVYRSDRLIVFGGWVGLINKNPRLQLARLKITVGNKADHLLHLNVAKSQIVIPHDLRPGFLRYIVEIRREAEKEFYNRGVKKFPPAKTGDRQSLFLRKHSNRGVLLELNDQFPLVSAFTGSLNTVQATQFSFIKKMITTAINKLRQTHEPVNYHSEDIRESVPSDQIITAINGLIAGGIAKRDIKSVFLDSLGYSFDSLPEEVKNHLK